MKLILPLIALLQSAAVFAEVSVTGFQVWKAARIEEARGALEKSQGERSVPSNANTKRLEPGKIVETIAGGRLQLAVKNPRVDSKLQRVQLNFELAQELTVNDYFVLYLSQLKGREAFIEAAKRLTPEESADLMMAFSKYLRVGGASYEDLPPPSAAGLAAPANSNKTITN
jgi:hypothetical protein